jgi:hypothetical protein
MFFSFCFALFIGANVGLFFDILAEKKRGVGLIVLGLAEKSFYPALFSANPNLKFTL